MHLKERLEALLAGVRTKILRMGQDMGQGLPLLVMPGLLGRDAEPAAEEASRSHEVYAPDPPGIRGTPAPKERMTVEYLGYWTSDLHTQVVGRRQMSLLGFSAGTTALIHYAASRPGAVDKLVLFEPVISGRELPLWLKSFIRMTAVPGATYAVLKVAPHLLPFLSGVNQVGYGKRFRLVEGVTSPRAAGEIARSLLHWDARAEIESLEIPVLIVRGNSSGELVPRESLQTLQGRHISHLEIDGLGHLLGGKGQKQVVEATRDFLKPLRIV